MVTATNDQDRCLEVILIAQKLQENFPAHNRLAKLSIQPTPKHPNMRDQMKTFRVISNKLECFYFAIYRIYKNKNYLQISGQLAVP